MKLSNIVVGKLEGAALVRQNHDTEVKPLTLG